LNASRSRGAARYLNRLFISDLAWAHALLGRNEDASLCIDEAISILDSTKQGWLEAEANRIAGQIALRSLKPDTAKAQGYFDRALEVARRQQAKSWELRASMSLARLWRDQGKVRDARELLAPVYGWFTEGFDTRDLKEAKALLEELAA
jgi:predicted ATPase